MYQLPTLSYSFQELEPFIDTHTLGLHYHKHEQNYLDKLNTLLEKSSYKNNYSLNELVYHINEFPESDLENILFNLGGVINHNLYWKSMHPKRKLPEGKLKEYIDNKCGSFNNFFEECKKKALSLKGAGYTFLVLKRTGELDIINTSNQDSPLFMGYMPLFNIDLWEHAYYINYENRKEEYINNFKNIADFENANQLFNEIIKK